MTACYALTLSHRTSDDELKKRIHELEVQVDQLKQEQAVPARVLNHYRNSIGYIDGIYRVGYPNEPPTMRVHFSGTGFLVGDGLMATNRHVAEPWYKDSEAEALMDHGATAVLESIVVYFPNLSTPVRLSRVSCSKISDLAILRLNDPNVVRGLSVLPLAKTSGFPGQPVTVIGYPMGIAGMVAKSPAGITEPLVFRHSNINAARDLAAHSLIRPSVTWGHLGDVVGDKVIYDAATAHGGSGGPVLNSEGEVIAVNSGYISGFSGSSFGLSVECLRPLLQEARAVHPKSHHP
jgi:serine protease Do